MINHKHKLVCILLPKTGTRSLLRHMKQGKSDRGVLSHYDTIDDRCSDYLKVATRRNPYARCVSLWAYWEQRLAESGSFSRLGFKDFMRNLDNEAWLVTRFFPENSIDGKDQSIHFLSCVDGVAAATSGVLTHTDIDFWLRTEALQRDFNWVRKELGLPLVRLGHKNRSAHKHYTEYYDAETRSIVEQRYAQDLEYFGYKFGD